MQFSSTNPDLSQQEWSFSFDLNPEGTEPLAPFVSGVYNRGSAEKGEDAAILNTPFIAVADGTSGVYHPSVGPKTYQGLTGGQVASRELMRAIADASPQDSLYDVLNATVARIRQVFDPAEEEYSQPALFGGATGVVLKLQDHLLYSAQWGDAYLIVQRRDGSVYLSNDQVLAHDTEMHERIACLMEMHEGDRKRMWGDFGPYLTEMRNQRINTDAPKAYGMLNHQDEFLGRVEYYIEDLRIVQRILIATDGLFPFEELQTREAFAKKVMEEIEGGVSLRQLLARREEAARSKAQTSHITVPEATGILLEF